MSVTFNYTNKIKSLTERVFILLSTFERHDYFIIIINMIRKILRSTIITFNCRRFFSEFREERDTFGPIQVPADRLWAAQTQRSVQNFDIARDTDRMPKPIIRSFGILKKSAALVNLRYGLEQNIGN